MNKDRRLAALLSFWFPCGGQLYNGDFAKAFYIVAVAIGAFLVLLFMGMVSNGSYGFGLFVGIIMAVVIFGCWIYSVVDAYQSSSEMGNSYTNYLLEKSRLENERSISGEPEPPPPADGKFRRRVQGKIKFKPFDPID